MISYFRTRRAKLVDQLNNGLIYVTAEKTRIRSNDTAYPFHQDPYFFYLTGVTKPDYHLLIDPKARLSYLFIPDINEQHLIWEGRQLTTAEAKKLFKTDKVFYNSQLKQVSKQLRKRFSTLHILPHQEKRLPKELTNFRRSTSKLVGHIDTLRAFKDDLEIANLVKANQIAATGFASAVKYIKPGVFEYQVQAVTELEFLKQGANHLSFNSIVAAGQNPAILHYMDNMTQAHNGDLIEIDAGCEWQGYCSDITRTYPVNGRFSEKQRDIYEIVLKANKECIAAVKPGSTFQSVHEIACRIIIEGLRGVGILKNVSTDELYKHDAHRPFFPHGTGHLLGLDAHDVGNKVLKSKAKPHKHLCASVDLKPGMVITIEPGIYFIAFYFTSAKARKPYNKYVDWSRATQYKCVGGIRIEDDILVTQTGHRNLTIVPKEVDEIEKAMRR